MRLTEGARPLVLEALKMAEESRGAWPREVRAAMPLGADVDASDAGVM